MLSESPRVSDKAITSSSKSAQRAIVPPQPDCGSSTCAPTTINFNFRRADGAWLAPAITSGSEDRPSNNLRLNFSIQLLLVLLCYQGRLSKLGQAIYIKLLVQVEAEKIGSERKFHRRIQQVFQAGHAFLDHHFGKQSWFKIRGNERRYLVTYAGAFHADAAAAGAFSHPQGKRNELCRFDTERAITGGRQQEGKFFQIVLLRRSVSGE